MKKKKMIDELRELRKEYKLQNTKNEFHSTVQDGVSYVDKGATSHYSSTLKVRNVGGIVEASSLASTRKTSRIKSNALKKDKMNVGSVDISHAADDFSHINDR